MPRYTGEEIKEAWSNSPRIARRQAEKAIPLIEEEISHLKGELQICQDIMKREMPDDSAPEPPTSELEHARSDLDEEGGVGSQQKEPEEATA